MRLRKGFCLVLLCKPGTAPKGVTLPFGSFSLTKQSQVLLSRFISFCSHPMREQERGKKKRKEKKQLYMVQGSPSEAACIEQILGKFSAASKHWITPILEQLLSAFLQRFSGSNKCNQEISCIAFIHSSKSVMLSQLVIAALCSKQKRFKLKQGTEQANTDI